MAVERSSAEGIGVGLSDLYADAQARLTAYIASHLARGLGEPDWAVQKLEAIADVRRFTERLVKGLDKPTQALASKAILDAATSGRRAALTELRQQASGAARRPLEVPQRIKKIIEEGERLLGADASALPGQDRTARLVAALVNRVQGTHLPILRSAIDAYREVVAKASASVTLGVEGRRKAAERAWNEFLDRGVTGFVDRRGRRWSLPAYVEMATRTAVVQASVESHNDQLGQLGIDLVQVSDVAGECSRCRPWEGKILTRTGGPGARTVSVLHGIEDRSINVHVAGSVDEAIAEGLMHPGCRHSFGAYIPGVTKPLTNTASPKDDVARRELRRLEREVRKAKTQAAAALTPESRAAARARARELTGQIESHVAGNPTLARRRDRERINLGNVRRPGDTPTEARARPRAPEPAQARPEPVSTRIPGHELDQAPLRARADELDRIAGRRGVHFGDAGLDVFVAQQPGWDTPGRVVSRAEVDALIEQGWTETWRGVNTSSRLTSVTPRDIVQSTQTGTWRMGTGIYGNGVYLSVRRTTAEAYRDRWPAGGSDAHWGPAPNYEWLGDWVAHDPQGAVMRQVIDPAARLADYETLKDEHHAWLEALDDDFDVGLEDPDFDFDAWRRLMSDIAFYAVMRGYDGYRIRGTYGINDGSDYPEGVGHRSEADQFVIFNRTVLVFEADEGQYPA